ncbi:MAG: SelT/SelW/SelH family protein [Planctomycetaceae bacterium]|nr:MAG: SelT/SelW/SelH family protein [Planctomycetaceae bacterium]
MAATLLTEYKQQLTGFELEPSSGGCFELTADGQSIYSKLRTGSFPKEQDLVAEVGRLLKRRIK